MTSRGLTLAIAIATLAACKSDPSPPAASQAPPPAAACPDDAPAVLSPRRLRRLSDVEYEGTVADLVGAPVARPESWAADGRVDGFDNDATSLVVSGPKLEGYVDRADAIGAAIAARVSCASGPGAPCAVDFAKSFARRAFGRPLTDDEASRLSAVYGVGASSEGHDAGMRMVATAILLSPSFLYRAELGDGDGTTPEVPLTAYEIASQLSFLFTAARPDDELLAAADRGELRDPARVHAHAERLLATPRAHDQIRRFFEAWLDLSRFSTVKKNADIYKTFTPDVSAAMFDEAERFLDDTVWNGSGTLHELLTSSTSFVPPALADVYGSDLLEAPAGAARRVRLDPARRRGILTLPALLALHATPDATSPVDRGVFVLVRLLCREMGPPPLAAQSQPVDLGDTKSTTRDKFARHASDPACASCHSVIDPIGFGFESFDTLGRFRDRENGLPVDPSGDLQGADVTGRFSGAAELVSMLAESPAVRACFVRQAFRFAEARREASACETEPLNRAVAPSGHRVQDILVDYTQRRAFYVRAGGGGGGGGAP